MIAHETKCNMVMLNMKKKKSGENLNNGSVILRPFETVAY